MKIIKPRTTAALGSWQNPRPAGNKNAATAAQLERFARVVLTVLDESTDWNAQTFHKIAEAADTCGLVNEATPVIASVLEQHRVTQGNPVMKTKPKAERAP